MNKKICFFLLAAIFLTACSIKQQLHSFPKEAGRMIKNESCDCDTITFFEDLNSATGYIKPSDGNRQPYSFTTSALYVDEEWSLLNFNNVVDFVVSFINKEILQVSSTFHGVEQTGELLNPFDGKTYFLFAKFDGKSFSLDISSTPKTPVEAVGYLKDTYSAKIYNRNYQMKVVRQWEGVTEGVKTNGEKIWHQYPDGAYTIISNDSGDKIKIFQGATPGNFMGIDTFTGYKSIAYVPKGAGNDIKRDAFLFLYASEFSQRFINDVQNLPDCLDPPKKQDQDTAKECNLNIVSK